jgi:hypothetical protein
MKLPAALEIVSGLTLSKDMFVKAPVVASLEAVLYLNKSAFI